MEKYIEKKSLKIIESCNTLNQLKVAKRFIGFINDRDIFHRLTEKINFMIEEKTIVNVSEKYGNVDNIELSKSLLKLKIGKGFKNNTENIHSLLNELEIHTDFKKVVKLHISSNNFNIIIKK